MADYYGVIGDVCEIDMLHGEAIAFFDQNAVVGKHAREALVGRRRRHGPLERLAIAVDGKISEIDALAAFATEDGSTLKFGSGVQNAVAIANDGNVVRAIRELHFRRNLGDAGGQ